MAVEVCALVWFKNEELWTTELCHLRIVDGKSLRFGVVERMGAVRIMGSGLSVDGIESQIKEARQKTKPGTRCMHNAVDGHLLVRMAHIHELFPETVRMPFKIACDYVRDRL